MGKYLSNFKSSYFSKIYCFHVWLIFLSAQSFIASSAVHFFVARLDHSLPPKRHQHVTLSKPFVSLLSFHVLAFQPCYFISLVSSPYPSLCCLAHDPRRNKMPLSLLALLDPNRWKHTMLGNVGDHTSNDV
jgi:hypothetical protein